MGDQRNGVARGDVMWRGGYLRISCGGRSKIRLELDDRFDRRNAVIFTRADQQQNRRDDGRMDDCRDQKCGGQSRRHAERLRHYALRRIHLGRSLNRKSTRLLTGEMRVRVPHVPLQERGVS